MKNAEWLDIVDFVRESQLSDWWAYECENDVQSLSRLAAHRGRYEVQLNWIRHSEKLHCHGCEMVSLILARGYGYYLHQFPANRPAWMFAAPGSLITMGPNDSHSIPAQKEPSLSLCVFDKQTDWHEHYAKLTKEDAARILSDAQLSIFELGTEIPEWRA